MSNIYLKVTIEKYWRSQNISQKFKKFVSRSVFGELQLKQISLTFKTSWCNLKIRGLGAKLCVAFLLFWFWEELWRFKVHAFCWTIILTFIKAKGNRKWKIANTVLERQTLCFSSYEKRKLKVKLWWVGARERKKRTFFVPFTLSDWKILTFVIYLNV